MLDLHIADIAVLVLYFIVVAVLGVWTATRVKSMSDFVMPRRFGKLMMIFFGFGAGTHSDQAVSVASKSYTNGVSGIWYQWLWLFVHAVLLADRADDAAVSGVDHRRRLRVAFQPLGGRAVRRGGVDAVHGEHRRDAQGLGPRDRGQHRRLGERQLGDRAS